MQVVNLEIWRDIIGYEGYFQISNKGRVKGLKRLITRVDGNKFSVKENIFSLMTDSRGHLMFGLSKNNKTIKTTPPPVIQPELQPIAVSPNPFTNSINFSLPDSGGKKVLIQLFDINGHVIVTRTLVAVTKNQKYTIDVPPAVKSGTYMLHVTVDGRSTSHVVMKQ